MSGSEHAGGSAPARGWHILLAAGVLYTAVILVVVAWRAESSTDFRDFWENAVHFRQTGEIAADLGVHNYLPFFTIFMLPWSFLPLRVAIVIFTLLSLGLFAITVMMAETLLGGGLGVAPRRAVLLALVLVAPYVHACAVLGNVGLLLLFLVLAAWFLTERGREWEAGAALGLATLIKLLPAALIIYFLLKRRWRVAGTATAVMLVLGLGLPLLTLGFKETIAQHQSFYTRALRGGAALETLTADHPAKALYSNNSVPIVLRRLLSPVNGGKGGASGELLVNIADVPRDLLVKVYFTLMVAFIGTSTVVVLHRRERWPPDTPDDAHRVRAEFGVWCCLMLLASPLVWTHYLPLVFWPLVLLADHVERWRRQTGRLPRVSAIVLAVWVIGALSLTWPAARAAGAQIGSVACLWLGLIVFIVRRPRHQARPI
jgi:hypothetical protein